MPRVPNVRVATLDDLDTLVAHRRRMWEDMAIHDASVVASADAPYRRWARARLRNGTFVAWIAQTAQGPVASGAVWVQPVQPRPGRDDGRQAYLLSMFTEPAWRGKGLARKIVARALAWTKREGFPYLSLHASDAGRPLYERLGFERTMEMRKKFRRAGASAGARGGKGRGKARGGG